LKTKKLQQAKI